MRSRFVKMPDRNDILRRAPTADRGAPRKKSVKLLKFDAAHQNCNTRQLNDTVTALLSYKFKPNIRNLTAKQSYPPYSRI